MSEETPPQSSLAKEKARERERSRQTKAQMKEKEKEKQGLATPRGNDNNNNNNRLNVDEAATNTATAATAATVTAAATELPDNHRPGGSEPPQSLLSKEKARERERSRQTKAQIKAKAKQGLATSLGYDNNNNDNSLLVGKQTTDTATTDATTATATEHYIPRPGGPERATKSRSLETPRHPQEREKITNDDNFNNNNDDNGNNKVLPLKQRNRHRNDFLTKNRNHKNDNSNNDTMIAYKRAPYRNDGNNNLLSPSGNVNHESLTFPPLLQSTGQESSTTTATTTTANVDEEATTSNDNVETIVETTQNSKQKIVTHRMLRQFEESKEDALSDDDGKSNASNDSSFDHPGAFAVQGLQFDDNNTTIEDRTLQNSMMSIDTYMQTQDEKEGGKTATNTLLEAELVADPIEAELVMETDHGNSIQLNQNISSKWTKPAIMMFIFVLMLCVLAAVLIALFVSSNKNDNESVGPSTTPSGAPTLVRPAIMTVLLEYFPNLPETDDQQEALDWILADATSLGLIMEDGMANRNNTSFLLERFVLATIYFATTGRIWRENDEWLSDSPVCDWFNIQCQSGGTQELRKVNGIDLSSNGLIGSIPTGVGLITSMTAFILGSNSLTGTIPTEVGLMTSLTSLSLYNNNLTGSIPTQIGLMTSLFDLSLSGNNLTGSIPTQVRLMTILTGLLLSNNDLSGSIPTEVGSLTNLFWFGISRNSNITGTIPSEVAAILPNIALCFMGGTNVTDIPENCQGFF